MILLTDGIALEAASGSAAKRTTELPALESAVPLTQVRCMASLGVVTFAAPCSGEVRHIELRKDSWLCARDAFLFCSRDVNATTGFVHKVGKGYFRDAGFVLYRLSGHGDAYVHCGGTVIEYDLVPGQRVSVDAGCVAAFQDTVQPAVEAFDGLPSTQGGSESLFLLTLTGPGKIYLSTLPISRIAEGLNPDGPPTPRLRGSGGGGLGGLVREL
jgi:uncharacterized protein (AIM24 family)